MSALVSLSIPLGIISGMQYGTGAVVVVSTFVQCPPSFTFAPSKLSQSSGSGEQVIARQKRRRTQPPQKRAIAVVVVVVVVVVSKFL
jgi:hypothetical protein